MEICEILVRSGAVDVVVIDSVAALVPKAEIEGDMGDSHMGLQARLMSQALRKLTGAIARSKTSVIFINQLREKNRRHVRESRDDKPVVRRSSFYASVRLDIRRIAPVKEKEEVIGSHVRVKVVKNKVAPPFQAGRVRHHVRRGHQPRGRSCSTSRPSRESSTSRVRGTATARSELVRVVRTRRCISRTIRRWLAEVEEKVKTVLGIKPPVGRRRGRAGGLTPPTAYNYALNLLAARPYASRALHRKLIQKKYSAADADDVIRRLLDNGLLNDERFAEQYARSKMLSTARRSGG